MFCRYKRIGEALKGHIGDKHEEAPNYCEYNDLILLKQWWVTLGGCIQLS